MMAFVITCCGTKPVFPSAQKEHSNSFIKFIPSTMTMLKKFQDAFGKDYVLIPLDEITEEARIIAVLWMEEEDRMFIANKHKLASDIMNYAKRYHLQQLALKDHLWAADKAELERVQRALEFKDQEIKMLKHLK
jgi:hypothetical protein